MRRVLIIGSGGAGKSTLARRLAERSGLPVIHLDAHYWHDGWVPTPKDEWARTVEAMIGADAPVDPKQLDSVQIIPSVLDDKGVLISGVPVTFQSADASIVTVSSIGMITSTRPAGATSVTVRGATLSATVPVIVGQVPMRLTIGPNPIALPQKGSATLSARLFDRTNALVPGAVVAYTSSDTLIVRVGADGVATSVGPAGQVTITARSGDLSAATTVTVTQVPTTIATQPSRVRVGRTRSLQLNVQVLDAVDARIANLTTFSYTSRDPTLFTVSATGLVTSVGPSGAGTIRVAATGTPLTLDVPVEILQATSPLGNAPTTYAAGSNLHAVAFAPADTVVASSILRTATSLNIVTGHSRHVAITDMALAVAYDSTRNVTYVGEHNGKIRQLEHANGVVGELLTLPQGNNILSFALSPDQRRLYVGGSGRIHTIDLQTKAVSTVPLGGYALHLSLHPDGRRAYASGNGSLVEVDLVAGMSRTLGAGIGGYWQGTAISSDGRTLWVGNEHSGIAVIDLITGIVTQLQLGCVAWGIALTRDERFVYASCPGGGALIIVDAFTRLEVRRYTNLGEVRRVAMSADGALAAVASGVGVHLIR